MAHAPSWKRAAHEMVSRLEADMRNGLAARDAWQLAAMSMAKAWYIRSWQPPTTANRQSSAASPPRAWLEAASAILRDLMARAKRRATYGSWERWAAQRSPIARRCSHAAR